MPTATLLLSFLAACDNAPEPCTADIAVWEDLDGDGWGGKALDKTCKVEEGQVEVAQDCDDNDDQRSPDAVEVCDGIDNDCNGQIDDGANLKQWWWDEDGDGYGSLYQSKLTCERPEGTWVANSNDCDDFNPTVNPEAQEVCGGGDEDCDGYLDEADDSVDPASFLTFYADKDNDTFGDRNDTLEQCRLAPGYVLEGNDCDDTNPLFTQKQWWEDVDGDGYGDPATGVMACAKAPAGTVGNDDDCDDTDPNVLYESDWYEDVDGDGYGSGPSLAFECLPPNPYAVRDGGDCDESSILINPDGNETCEDGIDQDCSGSDQSCGPVGSYSVNSGQPWGTDPPVYSCIEACAEIFGGSASDYHCSTSAINLTYTAYMTGWGDAQYCTGAGRAEDFSLEPVGNPGYNCGSFGCAYSAYTQDNCFSAVNWCWPN